MKKFILIFSFSVSSLCFSQQEFKLDIADAIVIKSLDFSYENYISTENSLGISVLLNLAGQQENFRYNENLMITPYFRHCFTTESQWNLFGEGFIGVNSGKAEETVNGIATLKNYTDTAIGIGVGLKYISDGFLTIDIHAGLGRNLFRTDSPLLVPRTGLNIGWLF